MSLSLEYRTTICVSDRCELGSYCWEPGDKTQGGTGLALLSGAIQHHMALYPIVSFQSNEEKTAWFATFLALAGAEKELRGAL